MRRLTRSAVVALALLLAPVAAREPAWGQGPPPNIILVQGDDWGFPYYGFMQRWMAAKIQGTCAAGPNLGLPCTTNGECPGSECASELVGDDPRQRQEEYLDPQYIIPEVPDPSRPSVDRLITPTFDYLAANGNFFPLAHNSASVSQPSFCIIMTGLYPEDYVLTGVNPQHTTSPVLPEWLPPEYLTMVGGKWQYTLSHVNSHDFNRRRPWDREMPKGGGLGDGARVILKPYDQLGVPEQQALQGLSLQRLKEFIACARCYDPSKCLSPPTDDKQDDSSRLAPRAAPGSCTPQPFFIMFSPFIPHTNFKFDENCPYFPRNATQCQTEPWQTHSLYCNDPSGFDWSCASYDAAISAALRAPGSLRVPNRELQYLKHVNTFDRALDELLVFLRCPLGGNPDCGEDLLSNTVLIHRSDHGNQVERSKGRFSENGYRTPMILFDPRPGGQLPMSTEGCAGQPGCRNEIAHAVDVRATIVDLSGSTFQCDTTCTPCDPRCKNACPCPRPDGQSRYSEGQSLRTPPQRGCGTIADPSYRQCTFGRSKGNQGIAGVRKDWFVFAEVTDGLNPPHYCKLYLGCGKRIRLHDLRADPSERTSLVTEPQSFCGGRIDDLVGILREGLQNRGWYDTCFEQSVP